MTTFSDGVYQFGGVPVLSNSVQTGRSIFVRPSTGSNGNDGKTPNRAVKTLAKALSLATADKNDVVYLIQESNTSSSTTDYQSSALDWNKDGVHLIGINPGGLIGQRSRISNLSTADAITGGLVIVSANNCLIQNIAIYQGGAGTNPSAASIALLVSGDRNRIVNCAIQGIGDSELDDSGSASLSVTGAENTIERCLIGLDTVIRSTATSEILMANARNYLIDCHVHSYTDSTSFKAITTTSSSEGRHVFIKDSVLSVITNITSADTPTGAIAHAQAGSVYLINSYVAGYDDVATSNNANIFVGAPAPATDSGLASGVTIS